MTSGPVIGIYAHHAGSGHLHRVRAIRERLADPGAATIFSSRAGADVRLPLDTPGRPGSEADPTAGGTLHYAPLHVTGLSTRLAVIADWIAAHRPRAFFVDVSVEVAAFVRLMGVPVVTLAMPGERPDPAHQLGYAQAAAIIAAWPDWVPVPGHLQAHADRLHCVGGITRLRPRPGIRRGRDLLVLRGAGGDDWDRAAFPPATVLGGANRVEDPMPHLQAAGCVVAAAGQNSVADLAAARAPAIVLAQRRPFGEQTATARVLADAGLAVCPQAFPEPGDWAPLAELARQRAGNWERWQTEGAAGRAARIIEEVAR
ncbi:hypothetical protein [Corynebacterium guangdongense]|uniref:Glycosyl transferase family 28 C-terminal domain-containing protein n=1 Tax=Corynebacterium guangdongense TaxID=1783348 RepID=A0ABU1ZW56_9CORY|nr:hypothetical protein [Corynebacterium guangdongense]MDR7329159.1 hypothetical protein [Corynebacterium guangdongense]WJZ17728.1 hypothetical protein CGUA_05720 [Corynebacterium guangdongense]